LGRIRVLADQLINRIAAGEVVERPASVVKELVENSLDADANSVRIELMAGGRRLIRVQDDGCGMDRDDALLAVERHATSKLGDAADLEAIRTLGFRGEALSSIAAVSRFLLRTSIRDGEGTEVEVRGGRIASVRAAGLPHGTSVQVERLFFNVPARRKFLRAESTELSHVVRIVTRLALAHPSVSFRLVHQERASLEVEPAADVAERIGQLYGRGLVDKLLPFEGAAEGIRLRGLAGRPLDALPRRDAQHLIVNGRAVQDRMLSHAVAAAYGNTMARGRYPALFLFLEIDPQQVDINVHPQKTEVRFRHASQVHDLVRDALQGALSHVAVLPELADLRPGTSDSKRPSLTRAARDYLEARETGTSARQAGSSGGRLGEPRVARVATPRADGGVEVGREPNLISAIDASSDTTPVRRAVALVQFRDSYIVAQDLEGLVLVDQHAAHERVLFERYLEEAESNRVEVQELLFPVTCDLAPHERILLEQEAEEFRRLGFFVEAFGGNTVRIDGVPSVAAEVEANALLCELLGQAAQARSAPADAEPLRHRLVTSAACQAAIKVNYPLAAGAMQALLDDLYATVNPSTCPHGRPTLFRLSLEEIERAFRRR
jgi:DNA mismatch repair protein MutL